MNGPLTVCTNHRNLRLAASIALVCLGVASSTLTVNAHSASTKADEKGLPGGIRFASIAHSEMQVLADFRPQIIALAERQTTTDDQMRRLLNFSKIQFTYCLWGIVPGALSDEESDFNACSHAYLASAWALLQHMETMPMARADAVMLKHSADAALAAGPDFSLCVNSAEVFYTDRVIAPPHAYAAAGGLSGLLLMAGAIPLVWVNRRTVR